MKVTIEISAEEIERLPELLAAFFGGAERHGVHEKPGDPGAAGKEVIVPVLTPDF